MSYLKGFGLTAIAAAVLMAGAAGSASATTLEINGVTKNSAVTIAFSLTGGNTWVISRTDGTLANTCTAAGWEATTSSPFTGTKVTGAVDELHLSGCSAGNPTVHQKGQLYVEHESGTTGGNVFLENTELTVPTSLGFTVNCKTNEGTKIGTLPGTASGTQVMVINAVVNCGFLLASARWTGTFTVTTSGLGVSA